jgi:plasmid maintenance system antidote protein VapI
MVNSKDFAIRLQKILDFYAITATAFSDLIDVNRSTISHLLSGRNKPSLEFVLKVLEAFPDVELYWLLNGQGHFPTLKTKEGIRKPQTPQSATPELFAPERIQDEIKAPSGTQASSEDSDQIERIVIFFKNGQFKTYKP